MKYYLHDTNSFNDEKITLLFQKFGYEGLGLFYTFLEKIAAQEQPISTEVLKFQLKVGKKLNKCWNFMEEIELISSNNGETFNKQLLNFSEKFEIKKEKNRNRVAKWRDNEKNKKSVTHYESVRNAPKVKLSKVNTTNDDCNDGESLNDYIQMFNQVIGKSFKPIEKLRDKWLLLKKQGYSIADVKKALTIAMKDKYHLETHYKYLTPEFFTRTDKLDKWLNTTENTNNTSYQSSVNLSGQL